MDFFVNDDKNFNKYVNILLDRLNDNNYTIEKENFIKTENFVSFTLSRKDILFLKIDLVNDIEFHVGATVKTKVFNKTDNLDNILSNKLSAVYRYSAKDVADIREICLHHSFDWSKILKDAQEKDHGFDTVLVAEILNGIPEKQFDSLMWKKNLYGLILKTIWTNLLRKCQ